MSYQLFDYHLRKSQVGIDCSVTCLRVVLFPCTVSHATLPHIDCDLRDWINFYQIGLLGALIEKVTSKVPLILNLLRILLNCY